MQEIATASSYTGQRHFILDLVRRRLSCIAFLVLSAPASMWTKLAAGLLHVRSAVRRHDENYLLALHYRTTGHAFDWIRASEVGNGPTDGSREFIEA